MRQAVAKIIKHNPLSKAIKYLQLVFFNSTILRIGISLINDTSKLRGVFFFEKSVCEKLSDTVKTIYAFALCEEDTLTFNNIAFKYLHTFQLSDFTF